MLRATPVCPAPTGQPVRRGLTEASQQLAGSGLKVKEFWKYLRAPNPAMRFSGPCSPSLTPMVGHADPPFPRDRRRLRHGPGTSGTAWDSRHTPRRAFAGSTRSTRSPDRPESMLPPDREDRRLAGPRSSRPYTILPTRDRYLCMMMGSDRPSAPLRELCRSGSLGDGPLHCEGQRGSVAPSPRLLRGGSPRDRFPWPQRGEGTPKGELNDHHVFADLLGLDADESSRSSGGTHRLSPFACVAAPDLP